MKENLSMRILVTGASGGIGSAICRRLAGPGARLGLHYHQNARTAERLATELQTAGAETLVVAADLSRKNGWAPLARALDRTFGGVDILVNNAGGPLHPKADGYQEEEWEAIFRLNFSSAFFLAQQFVPGMCRRGFGRIINVSSIGVKFGGGSTTGLYSAAKGALETWTISLARQGAARNVLVNAIRPGVINTALHARLDRDLEARRRQIPMQRLGTPEEVADLVAFLVSEKAAYLTGQVIAVSGGE